jgi:hypothetical protein
MRIPKYLRRALITGSVCRIRSNEIESEIAKRFQVASAVGHTADGSESTAVGLIAVVF